MKALDHTGVGCRSMLTFRPLESSRSLESALCSVRKARIAWSRSVFFCLALHRLDHRLTYGCFPSIKTLEHFSLGFWGYPDALTAYDEEIVIEGSGYNNTGA